MPAVFLIKYRLIPISREDIMDFRSLTYFSAVAEELNFTRASEKLAMSQPPLSNAIKQLEDELGVTLFIRGKRHLTLTPEGLLLKKRASQLLELSEKTRTELLGLKNDIAGTLSLGLVEGRAPYLAARWITGFSEEFPNVDFSLANGGSDDVLEMLARGSVDLAVIAAPYDQEHLEGILVGEEPWVAIIPKDHPLAEDPSPFLPLKKLAEESLIIPQRPSRVAAIHQWFHQAGIDPHVLCRLSSYVDAVALVEQQAGICIFPQTTYTPNPHIVTKVITDPPRKNEYVLVWYRHQPPKGLAEEFVNYVTDFLEEDRLHSEKYAVKGTEFVVDPSAKLLD